VGDGIAGAFEPDLGRWEAWSPSEVARRLEGVCAHWYVAAGWALDLFVGGRTRDHDDLEIGVPAREYDAVAERLAEHGLDLFVVGDGVARPPTGAALAAHHQTWARDRENGRWRVDVMREPSDGDDWVFRRDHRIRLPAVSVVARTATGIPYAQPEIVLLFKAKAVRQKDEDDFARVLPFLDARRRNWLREGLELVHPGHAWLAALTER
jgi:hypothetical protein